MNIWSISIHENPYEHTDVNSPTCVHIHWLSIWVNVLGDAILSAVQKQRRAGWNSARVNGSPLRQTYGHSKIQFHNLIESNKNYSSYFFQWLQGRHSTIYHQEPALAKSLQVLPGSLPGFQSLELLAWQPWPRATAWWATWACLSYQRTMTWM